MIYTVQAMNCTGHTIFIQDIIHTGQAMRYTGNPMVIKIKFMLYIGS